ncbi:flagellar basal body-associated FliL family protein [Megalodesulfovibrio gigas]|uniref:Flagellar protein FliL n=1 Tax=Megalodesulfovibrio gigas (strain ATCC 19364 / DSM 1382 / NCIMB 9332 / VKM B-1759) TaxID=1121448 RepID=T2G9I7_MEGG1|nr:flagellar basal body-associated FliL family protein [Megalodesulfovibrio gigas]AGW12953.1 putative flagellar basal body protein [Megalodesulfovibrio gigas DSM 1382 = ATCC 19364]
MADETQQKEKALLDTEELSTGEAQAAPDSDKVELDLDDAPFLDEEEEVAPEPEQPAVPAPAVDAAPARPSVLALLVERAREFLATKKGKIALGVAGTLLAGLVGLLLWSDSPPPPPPPAPPPPVEETAPEVELEPESTTGYDFIVSLEPFMVEYLQPNGTYRFLMARFSLATGSERVSFDVRNKLVVLRDAIFYYLRNKDMLFLSDTNNVAQLKKDLLSVINQYMAGDQLEVVLIEEYLIK